MSKKLSFVPGELYRPIYGVQFLTGIGTSNLEVSYITEDDSNFPMLFIGITDQFQNFPNLSKFRLQFLVKNEIWVIEDVLHHILNDPENSLGDLLYSGDGDGI